MIIKYQGFAISNAEFIIATTRLALFIAFLLVFKIYYQEETF